MKKFFQFVAVLSLLVATGFATTQVSAQSTGLGVTPRKDLTILPGKSTTDRLSITNLNKSVPLRVELSILDFKSSDETGTPALQLNANAPQTPWSLKPFITLPKTIEIGPGETKNVQYSIRIPEGQGAGSYYSAIRYNAEGSGDQNVTISASAATLAFVTVPGRATELLNLKEFGAYTRKDNEINGNYKSLYVSSKPKMFAYHVENVGNVAENPAGSIIIKNIFGKQVKVIKSANPKNSLALIGQTRRFETCIVQPEKVAENDGKQDNKSDCKEPELAPGIYRAHMNIFYGINGSNTQEINAVSTFWYLPFWFIGVVLAVLAVLAFVIFKVRKSLVGATVHRRNKRK